MGRCGADARRMVLGGLSAVLAFAFTVGSPIAQQAQAADPGTAVPATRARGVHNWWFDAMGLSAAHKQTKGRGATVALIDDAVDPSVPDLRGAHVTVDKGCSGRPGRPVKGLGSDHGTAMATLIAGSGHGNAPGGRGILGVAPEVDLQFYSHDPRPNTRTIDCNDDQIGRTMVRAARAGADIINLSATLGKRLNPYVKKVMSMGVVVVASIGRADEFGTSYPAAVPGVVSVLATDARDKPWVQDRQVDYSVISAPGVDAPAGGILPDGNWHSGARRTGTSGATAIVSGALALVKAKYPAATGNQLIQQLIHYPGGSGGYAWDPYYGFGIVSDTNMLKTDPSKWPDENPLLKGPKAAVKAYPMSIRGHVAETSDHGAAGPSAAVSPTRSAGSASGRPSATRKSSGGGTGIPGWLWVAVAAVVLLGLGGGVALNKRGSRSATTDDKSQGV